MATFLTGATGFLGSYIAAELLGRGENLNVLVRASHAPGAARRLWQALQLHFDFPTFRDHLAERIRIFVGDLTERDLGLGPADLHELVRTTDSIIHCAASLRRRSERTCLNVNLRGTLAVIRVARAAHADHGLRRFSHVSTVSVAGERCAETVHEDEAIDWNRRDYDAYGRTKKFAEHLVRELMQDMPVTIFRPSIILGDSHRAETTQFAMVRAFVFLAGLPVLPLRGAHRIDIVPADWVAGALVELHSRGDVAYDTYHLSAGRRAETYATICGALARDLGRRRALFAPWLAPVLRGSAWALARAAPASLRRTAALVEAFFPYLVYDTVFDSERVVAETAREPPAFSSYCARVLEFAQGTGFTYPYVDWPEDYPEIPSSPPRATVHPFPGRITP